MIRICSPKLFTKWSTLGENGSIMADQGFLISDYVEISVHHSIYQPFLNDREQLTKAEVKESQDIASVRIY